MKNSSLWLVVAVILVCALVVSGQQHTKSAVSTSQDWTRADYVPENCKSADCYAEFAANIPTAKGKLDSLARQVGILQVQINSLRNQKADQDLLGTVSDRITKEDTSLQKELEHLAALHDGFVDKVTNDALQLRQEFADFKSVACPLLQSARMDPTARIKLDSACSQH